MAANATVGILVPGSFAAVTARVRLGTSVLLFALHNPYLEKILGVARVGIVMPDSIFPALNPTASL